MTPCKPIIFSGPMVRAILDGRKTQTRRIVKDVPPMPDANCSPNNTARHSMPYLDAYCGERRTEKNPRGMGRNWHWWQVDDRPGPVAFRLPYAPGDLLWVREAFCQYHPSGVQEGRFSIEGRAGIPGPPPVTYRVIYRADGDPVRVWHCDEYPYRTPVGPRNELDAKHPKVCSEFPGWSPSIHMPRWASRITLEVTAVKVQRLQDISNMDAVHEGVPFTELDKTPDDLHRAQFADLWNSIHGPDAWGDNPWVAAYSFRRVE